MSEPQLSILKTRPRAWQDGANAATAGTILVKDGKIVHPGGIGALDRARQQLASGTAGQETKRERPSAGNQCFEQKHAQRKGPDGN